MRTVQQYGVAIHKITYWHDVLRTWIGATDPTNPKQARQFIFRIDPRDLSVIWFYAPDLLMYFPIPYRDSSHPVISIWELREIQRQLKREQKQNIDENMIFAAYSRMRELEQQAKGKTKAIRRAEQRRQYEPHYPRPKMIFRLPCCLKRKIMNLTIFNLLMIWTTYHELSALIAQSSRATEFR